MSPSHGQCWAAAPSPAAPGTILLLPVLPLALLQNPWSDCSLCPQTPPCRSLCHDSYRTIGRGEAAAVLRLPLLQGSAPAPGSSLPLLHPRGWADGFWGVPALCRRVCAASRLSLPLLKGKYRRQSSCYQASEACTGMVFEASL